MTYLATTCTPAELDAQISSRVSDTTNAYWTAQEVTDARNEAILSLFPKFRLKGTDVSLTTSTSDNEYTVPGTVLAYGDDAIVALDIDDVVTSDWEVWNGKLYTPRQGVWSSAKTIRIYYIKPFTVPPSTTTDVPVTLQPLVVLRAAIKLVDKKLMEANRELSSHWYGLKRQWTAEAKELEAEIEGLQKEFMVAGEIGFDGGHKVLS